MSQTVCQGAEVLQSLDVIWSVRGGRSLGQCEERGSSFVSCLCPHSKHSPQVVAHTKGEHLVPYQSAPQLQVCAAPSWMGVHYRTTLALLKVLWDSTALNILPQAWETLCSPLGIPLLFFICCLSASLDQGRCTTGGHIQYVGISSADTDHGVKPRIQDFKKQSATWVEECPAHHTLMSQAWANCGNGAGSRTAVVSAGAGCVKAFVWERAIMGITPSIKDLRLLCFVS